MRVKGKVSDVKARCRLRIGKGTWHACKPKPSGAIAVNLPARGTTPVTLSLRDSLGRSKRQTLRVPPPERDARPGGSSPRTGGCCRRHFATTQEGMRLLPKSRVALAAAIASLVLLAIPSIAGANPGTGPDLVRRSGQFTILHADMLDGSSTREPMLVDGDRQTPVHAPGDVWIEPGSRVRLDRDGRRTAPSC